MKYIAYKNQSRRGLMSAVIILSIVFVLLIAGAFSAVHWYQQQLKPLSTKSSKVVVNIPSGYSTSQIADLLQQKYVIKSATAFEWYVRNSDLRDSLKAGQYELDPSDSVQNIAAIIAQGKIQKDLFTILPGQRLDQIRSAFIKSGFKAADVDAALDPSNYKDSPALVAKPTGASLEGYLYPESFQTTSTSMPADIIKQSLAQMSKVLTPDLINQFQKQGLGIHQAVTLASIVEQEVSGTADRKMAAGVFLNRLKIGMVLGSDVTYHYAAVITGQEATPFIDSPYNTRKYAGLPPGPISNVSESSLQAVANPTPSEYLFFVAGDDGKTYFAKTEAEHEQNAKDHCKQLCSTY
jgi:UPF0755 protein